jgi:carbamoyltransferase
VNILGISAFYHDSAACLVRDGEIVAAAQEERFSRIKHDASFPKDAVRYCVSEAGLGDAAAVDLVAFYEKPFLKCDRLFSTHLAVAPRGLPSFLKAVPVWIKQKIWIKEIIRTELGFKGPILFPEHHESHAASAFFPSPFAEAAILTVDGVGEWTTTSIGRGKSNRVELLEELHFPHSVGLLYSAFTQYLGFRVNSGEYKVMGLAPYGEPRFADVIRSELLDLKPDGSFRLNLRYFDFVAGLSMTNRAFERLFGGPSRNPEADLTQRHMDVARSLQAVTEEIMLRLARYAHAETGSANLCLAGGVALNCVANGRILREGPFDKIWIQPAAGDAGGALGAALLAWHHHDEQPRRPIARDAQKASLLGPEFDAGAFLDEHRIPYTRLEEGELMSQTAALLEEGNVVGWFQGRMEFGPRALGNRSIIADPRLPEMQEKLNLKIKFRESFRPFAPAVVRERVSDYFQLKEESPYMLLVAEVDPALRLDGSDGIAKLDFRERLKTLRSTIPAVTHVDYSARVQTVAAEDSPAFYRLLRAFEKRTGCAVLVNTSFNVRGEPPVCTPEDAYRCFVATGIDYLVLGNCIVDKREQNPDVVATMRARRSVDRHQFDSSPAAVRRFACVVGGALVVVAGLLIYRHRAAGWPTACAAVLLLVLGLVAPNTLTYVHRAWMLLSLALGWVMTRIILTLVFVFVVTPIGLLQRAFGTPALDLAFKANEETYWKQRAGGGEITDYGKQF